MTLITPQRMLFMLRTTIYELENHFEVKCSTSHFTAVIIAPHWFYENERAAIHITLKRITPTLIVINYFE